MTARAQSLERFNVLTIWPLGMVNISPSVDRNLVTRSVTSSTVPSAGALMPATVRATKSPNPYCFSVMMKKPESRSCTMRCAPKPRAAPSTAAGATSDPTGMARMSVISTATRTNRSATDTQEMTDATAWRCLALSVRTSWSVY